MSDNVNVVPSGTQIEVAPGIAIEATQGVAIIDMQSGSVTTGGAPAEEKPQRPWTTKLTPEEKAFLRLMMIRATSPHPNGQPYLTPVFFRLIPVSAPGQGTMSVSPDWHLFIDFEFAMKQGLEWAAGVLNHEPWHILRGDWDRYAVLDGEGYHKNHDVWNWAMDMEINDDIIDVIPDDGFVPGNGAAADYEPYQRAEDYYHQLINDPKFVRKQDGKKDGKQGQGQQGNQPGQQGQGSGQGNQPGQQGQGSGQGNQPGQQGQGSGQGNQPGQGSGQGQQQGQGGGSRDLLPQKPENTTICAGGDVQETMKKAKEAGIGPGVDPVDAEVTKREVATRIKNSKMSIGNDRGAKAAIAWAEDYLLEEPINWRRELRATMSQQIMSAKRGRMDYSYKRPARRQPVKGVIMPGMVEPKLKLITGIDTSGSNVPNMGLIVEEIVKIAKQLAIRGDDFSAFAVDVDVDSLTPVHNPREVLKGRRMNGGTRMGPAYRFVASLRGQKKPNVFLLVTDGEVFDGDLPSEQPKGMNGTAVVTALVLNGKPNDPHNEQIVANAKKALSSWSKVICLYNVGE